MRTGSIDSPDALGSQVGDAVGPRRDDARRTAHLPGVTRTADDGAATELGVARTMLVARRAPLALVFALQLLVDLVDDLDAARARARVDRGELVGLGLEVGERGEDLAGGDERAVTDVREQHAT